MRPDANAELGEQSTGDGARRDAGGCLAGRGALKDVAGIVAVVLEQPGQVGVARSHPSHLALAAAGRVVCARRGVHDGLPVLPVEIANEQGNR